MRLTRSLIVAALALAASLLTPSAHAQVVFFDTDGQTIGSANFAYVGYYTPPPTAITVYANGGTYLTHDLYIFNDTTLNMSGGYIGRSVIAYDASTLDISGGSVGDRIYYRGNSKGVISGGANQISNAGNSVVTITGGTVSFAEAVENAVLNIRGGGLVYDGLGTYRGYNNATLCFFGTGLSAYLYQSNDRFHNDQYQFSSGLLLDGTDVTGKTFSLQYNSNATYKLVNVTSDVPEPGVIATGLALFGGLGLGLLRARRRRNV